MKRLVTASHHICSIPHYRNVGIVIRNTSKSSRHFHFTAATTACSSPSTPRGSSRSLPPWICQCAASKGRSGRRSVKGVSKGVRQSWEEEGRTLSSVTFQLRTFVFGASLVHCTNTPFTATVAKISAEACELGSERRRTVVEELLRLRPLVWPKLPFLPCCHHTHHPIPRHAKESALGSCGSSMRRGLTKRLRAHQTCSAPRHHRRRRTAASSPRSARLVRVRTRWTTLSARAR